MAPRGDEALTQCCEMNPFELYNERITNDSELVDCPDWTIWKQLVALHKQAQAELCLTPHPISGYLCSRLKDQPHGHFCDIPPNELGMKARIF
jgi:hypothetical protein